MTKLNFYPKANELKELSKPRKTGYAISLYRTFDPGDYPNWIDQIVALLRRAASTHGAFDTESEALEFKAFVESHLKGLKIERPSVAVFTDGEEFHLFNTYSRMTDEVLVSDRWFSVRQLLRTVNIYRQAVVLDVRYDGWDIYEYKGPEAPKMIDVDKGEFSSFEEFTQEVVEKHIQNRSHQDMRKKHLLRYAAKIGHTLSKHVEYYYPLIIIGDSRLAHEVLKNTKEGLYTYVVEKTIHNEGDLEHYSNEALDKWFFERSEERVSKAMNLVSAGMVYFDLSDAMNRAFRGDVETLYVNKEFEMNGSFDEVTGKISYKGDDPLISCLIMVTLSHGGEVVVLRDDDLRNIPGWNNEFMLVSLTQ